MSTQPVWTVFLFPDVGLELFIKLHSCVDDGYRATRGLAGSNELLNR